MNRRLLSTTGQKGLTKRFLQREGAWELIPRPESVEAIEIALSKVDPEDFLKERQRVRDHRRRFRLQVRSLKQSQAQLNHLEQRWASTYSRDLH